MCVVIDFFFPPHDTLVLFLFQSMCLRLRGHTYCHYHCHILARKCQYRVGAVTQDAVAGPLIM